MSGWAQGGIELQNREHEEQVLFFAAQEKVSVHSPVCGLAAGRSVGIRELCATPRQGRKSQRIIASVRRAGLQERISEAAARASE